MKASCREWQESLILDCNRLVTCEFLAVKTTQNLSVGLVWSVDTSKARCSLRERREFGLFILEILHFVFSELNKLIKPLKTFVRGFDGTLANACIRERRELFSLVQENRSIEECGRMRKNFIREQLVWLPQNVAVHCMVIQQKILCRLHLVHELGWLTWNATGYYVVSQTFANFIRLVRY